MSTWPSRWVAFGCSNVWLFWEGALPSEEDGQEVADKCMAKQVGSMPLLACRKILFVVTV